MLYYFASYIIAQFSVRVNSLAVKFSKSSCGAFFSYLREYHHNALAEPVLLLAATAQLGSQ